MENLPFFAELIISFLLVSGGFFSLIGALGLTRLPDFYGRLHGPTKATTLGVGSVVIASMVYFTLTTGEVAIAEVLVTVFLFLTAPVSANMLAKAAMHQQVKCMKDTRGQPWSQ
jgi:multicomponent K+:H+ antiporter subunit G